MEIKKVENGYTVRGVFTYTKEDSPRVRGFGMKIANSIAEVLDIVKKQLNDEIIEENK